ncbi:MAG: glycosyltransferase family 4 protein [Proteobacteria bacterium]|nr:glycosyltransferase family 4 protein [Pseudomonadota bacterium]
MRILHILSQTPDFTGSGKYLQEIIRQSRNSGHANFLLAGVPGGYELPPDLLEPEHCFLVRFDGADLDFPVAGMSDVMPYPSSVFSCLMPEQVGRYRAIFFEATRRAVARFAPDVLHTNHLWIATAAAREAAPGIPLVTTCHGTCLRQHRQCSGLSDSLKDSLQAVDWVIALFPDQKGEIHELFGIAPDKIDVISGGYDEGCFHLGEKSLDPQTLQLLYAGKLNATKGVPWLLKSLSRLADLPFHLHLAGGGSGPEQQQCLELAEALGERVTVHGMVSHAALGELMRQAHIFVLPSFFEGLPLVLLEAMACGCRIVTTDLAGARQLFTPLHPTMVRMVELPALKTIDRPHPEDWPLLEERLAAALRAGIGEVLAGGQTDQEYVREIASPFTWTKIYARVEDVYRRSLGERGGADCSS